PSFVTESLQLKRLGCPNLGNRIRTEPGYRHVRQNSDDRMHRSVKRDASTDHVRIAAEAFSPEIFRHHCRVRTFFFPGQKITAANRADSENIEIVRCQSASENLDLIAKTGKQQCEA